jgi:Fic family protein
VAGGWDWDGDGADPVTQREAENLLRQFDRVVEVIEDFLARPERPPPPFFRLSPELICELNTLAVEGITDTAGLLRTADVEITGSRHEPPVWTEVPALLEDLCQELDNDAGDPFDMAAYALWRINWIHPFANGNGRTARAVCYLLLCANLGVLLPGAKTLPERIAEKKHQYIHGLETADRNWKKRRRDVSELRRMLEQLVERQLQEAITKT